MHYISEAHRRSQLAGDGYFTRLCHAWLERTTGCYKAFLTHSCTAALEMSAILADISEGDEVIMPSYTFVSTANAFVLRGGVPVFVDIRPDTLNIDEALIESAITCRTKAIVVVHYAGNACDMDVIIAIARRHNLLVIEDAAQGVMASYKGKPLGSIGDFGCFSFHETKNITSGEGGALLINNPKYALRAEIIRDKGTNRSQFFRGEADKYSWVDIGSSFLPGEIIAAFLFAQIEEAECITKKRLDLWSNYHYGLQRLENDGILTRPRLTKGSAHNAHMYYVLFHNLNQRTQFISSMRAFNVNTVFHYVPLHCIQNPTVYFKCSGSLPNTQNLSDRIVRLPLWIGLDLDKVFSAIDYSVALL